MNTTNLERLAVLFRTTYNTPSLAHVDTWNAFESIGGRAAILYGSYMATPIRNRWRRQDYAYNIASELDLIISRKS